MNRTQLLLILLAEECAEVAHRVSKALRFPLEETEDGQPWTNRQRLAQEITDLEGILRIMRHNGILPDANEEGQLDKFKRVERWLIHSAATGALTEAEHSNISAQVVNLLVAAGKVTTHDVTNATEIIANANAKS